MSTDKVKATKRAYRVHCGHTRKGNDRWRYFANLDDAITFCSDVARRTRIILSIEKINR